MTNGIHVQTSSDKRARQISQTEFVRPILLEAGAGTGKTAVLIARIVAWTVGPGWERAKRRSESRGHMGPLELAADVLRRTVAITFTEAASGEMANRLRSGLIGISTGDHPPGFHTTIPSDALTERARALLSVLDVIPIQTIHAFCRAILTKVPLEAGLHPHFSIDADGVGIRSIAREVVKAAWSEALSEDLHPDWLPLVGDDVGPRSIEDALVVLLQSDIDSDALSADPFTSPRLGAYASSLSSVLKDLQQGPASKLTSMSARSRAQQILDATSQSIRALHALEGLEGIKLVQDFWTLSLLRTLQAWSRQDFRKSEIAAIGDDKESLAQLSRELHHRISGLVALKPNRLRHAQRVLAPLLSKARDQMRSQGIETFSSLLYDTRDLLQNHPDIASLVRQDIDQILVDEFQDTDIAQCSILECLAFGPSSSEKIGLFLVGDPKQSIYGFRNADLQAYENFGGKIKSKNGLQLALTSNFRSVPQILENVSRIMEPIMEAHPGVQPSYQPVFPSTETAFPVPTEQASVEFWLDWLWKDGEVKLPTSARASEIEAEYLTRDLLNIHKSGNKWSSVALLFRSHSEIDPYLAALRKAGIPYRISRDRSYYQRREIVDAVALLRCILDPFDTLALVTWLRSPYVGIPDAALLPLWSGGFPEKVASLSKSDEATLCDIQQLVNEVITLVPGEIPGIQSLKGWGMSLLTSIEALAVARDANGKLPPDEFVSLIREMFLVEATESIRYEGRHRVENLERLWTHLVESMKNDSQSPEHTLDILRRLITEETYERKDPNQESDEDAVLVTTIHSAKGLDFDHVYLLRTHRRINYTSLASNMIGSNAQEKMSFRLLGAPTLSSWEDNLERDQREHAEQVRLLYVALTRARQRIVIAGSWPLKHPTSPDTARSLSDLVAYRQGPTSECLVETMSGLVDSNKHSWQDESGTRWVFLGLTESSDPVSVSLPKPAGYWPSNEEFEQARIIQIKRRKLASDLKESPRYRIASRHTDLKPEKLEIDPDVVYSDITNLSSKRDYGISLALGTAVHAGLESIDFASNDSAAQQFESKAIEILNKTVPQKILKHAQKELLAFSQKFTAGTLFARLRNISPHIIGREVPILLSASSNDNAGSFVSGTIDLIYTEPATQELVIVDYKTDRLSEARTHRIEDYRAQGNTYANAVRTGLHLKHMPRFELWWLRSDDISRISVAMHD